MKKIFAAAAIALVMITSCSDDDSSSNSNNNTDMVLLKKMIITDEYGTYTSTYTYNGTKIDRINNSDGTYEVYSYTDEGLGGLTYDLIKSKKSYDSNNELLEEVSYLYNFENQLIAANWFGYNEDGEPESQTIKYTHNSDGTITWEDYEDTTSVIESGKIYTNKFETNVAEFGEWAAHVYTTTFTYDGKNNPWKNVTGYDRISFAGAGEGLLWSQNITSEVNSTTLGSGEGDLYSTTTYTYNSANFPVTSEKNESGYISNIQYFYE